MDNDKSLTPLKNDPAREAVDSLRGYSYQMLRSIEAWLDLSEGQILYLEGAEDLDRIDAANALVEQVKDTVGSGNLTLRSVNALAAIGNLWQHSERNPGISIQFRYLTTSGIGQERGNDLPLSSPGIAAWQEIRCAPSSAISLATAKIIQDFLRARGELPVSFRNWLRTASVESFISRIVEPLEWVTNQPGAEELRMRIENRLIELGEPRGISAAHSAGALGALHVKAWANATDSSRAPLRRGDYIRVLEAAGSVTIPMAQLMELMKQLTGKGTAQTEVAHVDRTIAKPPRTPVRRLARPQLESAIGDALHGGTVLIHGSTGVGKTLLATVVTEFSHTAGWIDLRDLPQTALVARLDAAAEIIEKQGSPITIVLDDLEVGDDPRSLLPPLGRLTAALTATKSELLITGAQRLPPRVAEAVNLTDDHTFAAPLFESDEIASYFIEAGCPADAADTWSKIVFASTSGHPQLVDARLYALQQLGWPSPSIREWLSPTSELVDVRAEARRMVSALSEDERELLSRASLVIGRISRLRLMAVGRIPPALNEPGHTIDRLTGPWLEVTDTSDLRVSPLLRGLGAETRGQPWSTAMYGSIAWAWLADRSLSATDVATLLLHSMLSGKAGPLVSLLPSLLDASAEVWKQIGESAGMFASFGVGEQTKSPFKAAIDTAVLRILQLRIAAEAEPDKLEAIVAQALKEADERDASDIAAGFFDFLFLWQLMSLESLDRDVQASVDLGLRFMRLAGTVRDALARYGREGRDITSNWPDLSPIVSLTLLRSVSDAEEFGEFLDIIGSLGNDEKRSVLPGHTGDIDVAAHTLDRLWLSEIRKTQPNWTGFAALLKRTVEVAIDARAPALANAAAALLIRVIDEDLEDAPIAIVEADRSAKKLGYPTRVLAAKAKVLWRSAAVSEALEIYDRILPDLDVPRPYLTDILREAAIAAGRAKQWSLCSSRFAEAASSLLDEDPVERFVGLMFDQGLALHLANSTRSAVDAFGVALDRLIEDGREPPPEPLLSVRQFGSQAIKSVLADVKGERHEGAVDPETFIGMPSSLDTLNWGEQRPASTALLASQLLELDLSVARGPTVAIRLSEWVRGTKDGLVLATTWSNFNRLAIATSDMAPLMNDTIREISYLAYLASEREAGRDGLGKLEDDPPIQPLTDSYEIFFFYRILLAIVSLMAKGAIMKIPLRKWQQDLPSHTSYDRLRSFLADVETVLFGLDDPWWKVVDKNPTWQAHALAAIAALGRDRTPSELITAQSLAAHYLNQPQFGNFVAVPFSDLVTQAWDRLCDTSALLATPRLSVPAILESIASTTPGWARTKAVLRAALDAVPIGTARQVREHIQALPDT